MVKRANPQPLAQLLAWAAAELGSASPTPRLDAELLMAEALGGWSRARVLAEAQHTPTPQQQAAFERMVGRRAQLEPVAYIIGRREFYGMDFEVTPDTLVPRPETELLVELALAAARRMVRDGARQVDVADIGTGTGCISVAVAANCPAARVLAVDVSAAALAVAARNVARHRLGAQVRLAQGDLLGPLAEPVDMLLSNPPYTILADIDENVRRHEPHLALDGGPDGLDLYRRLLADAPARLVRGGVVILEIGDTQGAAVAALARAAFPGAAVEVYRDLAGLDRVVLVDSAGR